ncbi:MAG: helix-turn-helix domain-containing protein [Mariniphaga sp.]
MRKRRGRTQDEMAFALKMKRPTLSGYENGVAQPGIQQMIAYSEYFGISIDTLIKIDLSKLRESELRQLESGFDVFVKGSKLRVLTTTVDSANNENIELVPEKAKAGYMRGFADPEFVRELPVFQLPFLSPERKYRTFQISGDSMLPIPDGAWVTGEFVQDWNTLKSGEACIVLTLDEGIVFKMIENRIRKEGKIELTSLNQLYRPYELAVVEIREIWRFVHYISEELPLGEVSPANLAYTLNQLKQDVALIKVKLIKSEK